MHLILTIPVCYMAGIFALIWQMRKLRQETQIRKMTLTWTSMESQPHPEKLGFYSSTPAMILPKFARFITSPPPFHSALFIPGVGGAGPADTWWAASQHRVGAPYSKGPTECCLWSHTVFLSRP